MANPQLENGFTQLANELYLAIIRAGFNGSEASVLHFIIYQTYGYHRTARQLSASYISNGSYVPIKTVRRCLTNLIKNNVVISKEVDNSQIKLLSVNKDYSQWVLKNRQRVLKNEDTQTLATGVPKSGQKPYSKTSTNTKKIKQERIKQERFFEKPKIEDVISYGIKQGYSEEDCKRFFYYYDGIGWVSGKSKVINWESQLKAFMLNSKQNKQDRCNNAETSKHQDNYTCDEYGNITHTEEWE